MKGINILLISLIVFGLMTGYGGVMKGKGNSVITMALKAEGGKEEQGQEQEPMTREQTILHIFGRLNPDVEPFDNINCWTDGEIFLRPFFFDVSDFDNEPRANGDTIYLFGGTLHEGGYGMNLLLAADGSMTIAGRDYKFNKGDRVEYRLIDDQPLLLFSDLRTVIHPFRYCVLIRMLYAGIRKE
jgi:hypothetical protein